jgi:HEAT repeat protein
MTRRTLVTLMAAAPVLGQSPADSGTEKPGSTPGAKPRATVDEASWNQAWQTLDLGLVDGEPEHRKTAVAATGSIGAAPDAVERVTKALQDKTTLVRQAAAAALGEMGAREAIPALKEKLDDNPEVSFTAAKALWDLGADDGRWIFQEVLEGERKDAPGRVHTAVRDAKRKLHNPTQLALMGVKEATGAFLGPASMGITVAQQALKLKDTSAPGRIAAVEILAKDSDPYALTLLEWALGDTSWAVRAAVAKALGNRGNQRTILKLMPLLTDDRHAVRYLAAASIVKLNLKAVG